jgi:hypothetical protein
MRKLKISANIWEIMQALRMNEKEQILKCPICKKPAITDREKNPYLPFCSERCRTIDLGAWLDGKYVIESDEPFFDSEQ